MTLVQNTHSDIGLRPMTQADIPLGLWLTAMAGWNQTAVDWRMLLDAGLGWVATVGDHSVGTATVVPYGTAFSWIGMVQVDPAYRRRGVGTALLQRAIAEALPHGCARLDATPQGEPLYARLGFRAEYGLLRMVRPIQNAPYFAAESATGCPVCRALDTLELPGLIAFDTPIFGAPRGKILGALARNAPRSAHVVDQGDEVRGYCLGRSGARYEQIGPLVAHTPEVAQALLLRALAGCAGRPVVVDVLADKPAWVVFLENLGFVAQRPFARMCLGGDGDFGLPECQYAIAGPEIG